MGHKIKVAVLMGGRSSEREVSLSTGRQVMESLDPHRYEAVAVDTAFLGAPVPVEPPVPGVDATGVAPVRPSARDLALLPLFGADRPDVAFLCLHGKFGEDGTIQGLLELLDIPYTGSGVMASALAMSKVMSKKVLAFEGIRTPQSESVRGRSEAEALIATMLRGKGVLTLPVVVKPSTQGSTIGISVVREPENLAAALETALAFDDEVLVEEFIEGIELTAPVIGNAELECLPLVEIVPNGGFYDYEAKYTPGATDEIVPARVDAAVAEEARELALRAHRALDCRGFSRTDMIASPRGVYVLEVNTIPGMTPTSLLPRSAAAAGLSFPRLLDRMIELALEGRSVDSPRAAVA